MRSSSGAPYCAINRRSFRRNYRLKANSLFWGAAVEGGIFASWAAIVLAIPLLFTLTREALGSLSFFSAALLTVLAFLFFCLALGSWASMLLARVVLWVRQHLIISILSATVVATLDWTIRPACRRGRQA